MENKIIFVGLRNIESKKGTFYMLDYVKGTDTVKEFITEEVFQKIASKKPGYLKEVTGIYELQNTSKGMQARIVDIK